MEPKRNDYTPEVAEAMRKSAVRWLVFEGILALVAIVALVRWISG